MGTKNKTAVRLVISHIEGCSGNFLGRLYADTGIENQSFFRIDHNLNDSVLAIDGRTTWKNEIEQCLKNHIVIVTHSFDILQIKSTFPNCKIIQIYPYKHIGNVLYNICKKKLAVKIENPIDNYFIDINYWFNKIQIQYPRSDCFDFWDLRNKNKVENLLDIQLNASQEQFFTRYWSQQLQLELDIPYNCENIADLINHWKIQDKFDDWFIAWTLFVYEKVNNLKEENRNWSIDDLLNCNCWQDVIDIVSSQKSYLVLDHRGSKFTINKE